MDKKADKGVPWGMMAVVIVVLAGWGAVLLILVPDELREAVFNAWMGNWFITILGWGTCFVLVVVAMDYLLREREEMHSLQQKMIANWIAGVYIRLSDGGALSVYFRAMKYYGLKNSQRAIDDSSRMQDALRVAGLILSFVDPEKFEYLRGEARWRLRNAAADAAGDRLKLKAEKLSSDELRKRTGLDWLYQD